MRMFLLLLVSALIAACSPTPSTPSASTAKFSLLPGVFVAPESCARFHDSWIVSDKGCSPAQPCWRDPESRRGAVVQVRDDGTRTTLIDGLTSPNGVAVDADNNIWVVDGKAKSIVVRSPDGTLARTQVEGAQLLNDVAVVPWGPGTVVISDSVTGQLHVAALDEGRLLVQPYYKVDGAPNGIAPSHEGDGVVVSGLGDLVVPGRPGGVSAIGPSEAEECGEYHGGSEVALEPPPGRKLDGIVPYRRGNIDGYIVSAIVDTERTGDVQLDTTLWFVAAGRDAELLLDLSSIEVDGARAVSAADIGLDPERGTLCVPDLNGSRHLDTDGDAGARVYLVDGL